MVIVKNNKVNVELIVPAIGKKYNIFLPANKTIGEIIIILNRVINELTGCFPENNKLCIFDVMGSKIYDPKVELINTDIKNGSILALIS